MRLILVMALLWVICPACAQKNKESMMDEKTLIRAVTANDTVAVKAAIANGEQLEVKDEQGRTPLMVAAYANSIAVARILINAGANVNAQDNLLNSPFLHAGATGYTEMLKMCMQAGADYGVYNGYGGTALIPACERGHIGVIEVLLADKTFPVNHINRLGWTALMEAVILGQGGALHLQVVNMLIAAGVDVNISDFDGLTPLQHARKKGFTEIAKALEGI